MNKRKHSSMVHDHQTNNIYTYIHKYTSHEYCQILIQMVSCDRWCVAVPHCCIVYCHIRDWVFNLYVKGHVDMWVLRIIHCCCCY